MTSEFPPPAPIVAPRPGVLQALGICNIVFAVLSMICIGWSTLMVLATWSLPPEKAAVPVQAPANQVRPAGTTMVATFDPFMVFKNREFVRFSSWNIGVGTVINGVMFATGIGLLNRKRWAAIGWGWFAWVRIASAVILWGFYIVAVSPSFSEAMAREVMKQFAASGVPAGRGPTVGDMTRIYSIMNLILAVGAMGVTSTYPGISLWLLSRPGVKAAIIDKSPMERDLP